MGIEQLELIGGHACLDFVNTAGDHLSDQPGEWLLTYRDLLSWAQRAGLLTGPEALRLEQKAGDQPDTAEQALARAVAMREAIYRLLLVTTRQPAPGPSDLALFTKAGARLGRLQAGAIAVGQLADLIVLPKSPLDLAPAEILNLPVDITVIGGRVV